MRLLTLTDIAAGVKIGRQSALSQIGGAVMGQQNTDDQEKIAELECDRDRIAAELEEARQDLSVLAYVVSHDLTAPLRAIDGYCSIVREDCGTKLDDASRLYLEYVQNGARRMAVMLEGLTQLSRIMRQEFRRAPVDLGAFAVEAVAHLRAASPGRDVTCVIGEGLLAAGDPDLLRSCVRHLIENAWKFTSTREAARIEIGRSEGDSDRPFFVRDNGVGFDMQHATRLFQPLQRLHPDKEFPGSGIGLAIVHRIVRRHGGRIWAEAAAGEGATFFFTLGA